MLNTCENTADTKSSLKPQSCATINLHLRSSGERIGKQRSTKVSFGRTIIRATELQRLAKGTSQEKAILNGEELSI